VGVAVVDVRIVRVLVHHDVVLVPMPVRLLAIPGEIVRVLVMGIVPV
jgi:hypothetical protein